jgi:hypothetical protein
MSDDRRRRVSLYANGKVSKLVAEPRYCGEDLELDGAWSRAQLLRMDERFVARMERAIKRGLERCV